MNQQDLNRLLAFAIKNEASDVHLSAGSPPLLRVHGKLHRLESAPLSDTDVQHVFDQLLTERQKQTLETRREVDLPYVLPKVARFRTHVFYHLHGLAAAFRAIPDRVRPLGELPAPKGLYPLCRLRKGIVLLTGPTGCGKSTTLAAMVDVINQERREHIITIEDPIEYVHENKNCLINQRQVGDHTHSFHDALRSALREDPDIILVGEMRDLETISLALTAAETGHLVFATLHTLNAAETVNRIVDVFPSAQQRQIRTMFANALQGIVAQRLLPTRDGKGRVAAYEILIATPAVRNLIREAKSHQLHSTIQTGTSVGMQTMDQALKHYLEDGVITREEALANATDKTLFQPGAFPAPLDRSVGT